MSGFLVLLDKHLGVRPVDVGENLRRLFAKLVLWVTGPEATSACKGDHIFARIKFVIGGAVHGVQTIWDTKSTMEDWVFLLVDAKNAFKKIN